MEANDQLTLIQRDHRAQLDTLIAQYQAAQNRGSANSKKSYRYSNKKFVCWKPNIVQVAVP
jgi:hypothetical protein